MSNKSTGNRAEHRVLGLLTSKGMLGEIIETKMRIIYKGGRAIQVADKGSKLGDIFGVLAGRAVLVEVKAHDEDVLQYSVLKDHQHANLTAWQAKGGMALVGWVRGTEARVFPYPVDWEPRQSLSWKAYE